MRYFANECRSRRDSRRSGRKGVVTASRGVEAIARAIVAKRAVHAAQPERAAVVEAIVECAQATAACTAIEVVALIPFHGERPIAVDAPRGLHVLDRAIVAIEREAEQRAELLRLAETAAIHRTPLPL